MPYFKNSAALAIRIVDTIGQARGYLLQSLEETAFPPNVQILEAGTVSHQLIPAFRSIDYLIVIDIVGAGDVPGSIFRFPPEDMNFHSEQRISLHQISLTDVLQMAAFTGAKPKTGL